MSDPKKTGEKKPAGSPDELTETTKKGDVELTEEELGRVGGGLALKVGLKIGLGLKV
jgi:hypothetical protein